MIVHLNNRSLIKVFGKDSESFLQSQLTNDISKIKDREIQINAFCQHQGKVLAILWVFKLDNCFYISVHKELGEILIKKFNIYKFMSDVVFQDLGSEFLQYGIIDQNFKNSIKFVENLYLLVSNEEINFNENDNLWSIGLINSKIPEVNQYLSEKFIPQELNLDIEEVGVSFTKGCYPGQEVVARMHYLGKPKRRLFQFLSKDEALIGDAIHTGNSTSLKPSGVVISAVHFDGNYHILGTLEIKHEKDHIFLEGDISRKLTVINA